jgi:hypothetical protein
VTSKEWGIVANQLAMEIKKTKKTKKTEILVNLIQLESAVKACTAVARLTKLAEKDSELASPDERLVGEAAGRAAVWGLVMQELEALE